jgi:GntR family transcriptional regulator, transcriptional repressor for pyruvate dehydrogenase complex
MEFEPINKGKTIVQKVVDQLLTHMTMGKLKPGDTLPIDSKLAEIFKVSRSAIREALIILEARDFIEVIPRKGALIRAVPRNIKNLGKVDIRFDLSLDYVSELLECFVSTLETRVTLVCRKRTSEDLRELNGIYSGIEACVRSIRKGNNEFETYEKFADQYMTFHKYLGKATHNIIHESLTSALIDELRKHIPLAEFYIARQLEELQFQLTTEKKILLAIEKQDLKQLAVIAPGWMEEIYRLIREPLGL